MNKYLVPSPLNMVMVTLVASLFTASTANAACVIKMVYKDGGKEPLIAKKPKHDGVYFDLYTAAAQRIGCSLEISRLPKKRLHVKLAEGTLDFYPGASFSKKRANYLYYIPNGLDTGEYGVTNLSVPDLKSYDDLKTQNIAWLMELGSSKVELAKELGIKAQERTHQDLEIVSKFIMRKPNSNYFYVADKELVDYYPRKSGIKSLTEAGLKVHKECCGGDQPMYMGFSRFSPHFKEEKNPSYDANQKLSPANFPTIVNKNSVVHRLGMALADLKKENKTADIYQRWFFQ